MPLLKKKIIPDQKDKRPETIGEALRMVNRIFAENDWREVEQRSYFESLGISGTDSPADVRKIINDMERSKMILFAENETRETNR